MPLYQAVLLALIQGFTEFLPISSSAHLALCPWLLGWQDQGLTFDIALHLGTLVAVLVYFARDWFYLFLRGFGVRSVAAPAYVNENPHLLWHLALATLPVGIVGLLLKDVVETALRSPYSIGFMLIVVGLLIGYADRRGKRDKQLGSMRFVDTMTIGFAQALAVVPGTSRSGITIATALLRNLDRESAARFSFLLSTPAIGGAALKAVYDMVKEGGLEAGMAMPFAVGILVSCVTGVLVIAFFLRYLRRNTLRFFVLYRVIFGIIILLLAYFRPPAI
ncbi:MAG: undecaprenyl-diphosphatase UppP [Bryobacterales bacterium]|jgi:undecaprenyl-diphosphatase|nr:undecaprenyl-diphosphatase UppP [Bryobacterales bacterium]